MMDDDVLRTFDEISLERQLNWVPKGELVEVYGQEMFDDVIRKIREDRSFIYGPGSFRCYWADTNAPH